MPRIRPATRSGMKGLERVDPLAHAGELDRLAGDRAHRQGRAAAGVAVEAGEDDSGKIDLAREAGGDVDRVLAGQASTTSSISAGLETSATAFISSISAWSTWSRPAVSSSSTSIALELRGLERAAGDVDRLLARRRSGRVATSACSPSTASCSWAAGRATSSDAIITFLPVLLAEAAGDLGGRGGLARALEADHHHDGGRRDVDVELGRLGAEHLDQRVVDDLDDLLARRDRAQDLLADRLLGHLVDELADHRQGDVGLEQGDPDLAHRGPDVGFVECAAAAQAVEDVAETIAQAVEHRSSFRHRP